MPSKLRIISRSGGGYPRLPQYREKPRNLYSNFLHPITGQWGQDHASVGALGDSFYEYLLKEWLRSGKADKLSKKIFDEAVEGIEEKLLQVSSQGQMYLADASVQVSEYLISKDHFYYNN